MSPRPEIEAAKRRLRASQRALRAGVAEAGREEAGRRAAAALERDRRWCGSRRVGLFASRPDEPATRPIFDAALGAGRQVLLPRCPSEGRLEFAPVAAWDELRPGRYGLLEPVADALEPAWRAGDVVLLPGVAFDLRGSRLGRGGGYYDRYLATLPRGAPWLLGLGFGFQIVSEVPMDEHDRRIDGVLAGGELTWIDEA